MPTPILTTKLYIPPPRPRIVPRPCLIDQLSEGVALGRKLTLISASAGFGKTTLVSEWVATCGRPVAWLSLDAGENDPVRFFTYLIAALQTLALSGVEGSKAGIGEGMLAALRSSQPPPIEAILTTLLNELAAIPEHILLVLDDYHALDSQSIDHALSFLIEHLPPQMHLVIATREDPRFPLARLRVRGQLTELRAADLRFTPAEAAEFLNQVMGLNLSAGEIAALETRTEGWIAGLQLAALSMQGQQDTASFIQAFTGSHHFVLDYLVEEVLQRQPASIQNFLLRTSLLDRMCGPLCDDLLLGDAGLPDTLSTPAQTTLEYLEHANLFVVPLDDQRRWYRYHHLFAELLRQRLGRSLPAEEMTELHIRASRWFEDNALEVEAFHHAAAANDIERADRLIRGGKIPLHSFAVISAVLAWLDSLPKSVMDARPWLWVRSATSALMAGQTTGVEEKLRAAEAAMQHAEHDDKTSDLIGQIAAIRATLALLRYELEVTISQARRALEHLHPDNLQFRSRATWALGFAYRLQGDRTVARQVYAEAIRQAVGNTYYTVLASTSLGQIQELDNQLHQAAETYRRSLHLLSDQGPPNAHEEYIGLARIFYEWNDLAAAEQHGQRSLELARQYDRAIDRYIASEVLLARVKLARGDVIGARAMLAQTEQSARQNRFTQRLPEIAAVQALAMIRQGELVAAERLVRQYDLPLSLARVFIAQDDQSAALAVLEPFRQQMEARGWADERLRAIVLQAVALQLNGENGRAAQMLAESLALARPGGFIRLFVDEGKPMAGMLRRMKEKDDTLKEYIDKLLVVFGEQNDTRPLSAPPQALVEPLSQRELEILRLIAQGLSNREIGAQLFLALDTVKGHNRRIFDKLLVERRTEAIARARVLGLL